MTDRPRYEPYLDVPASPFRWRLGVRPLDIADWIEIDDRYTAEIARKREIMATHPTTAFHVLDDVVDESAEVLDAIVDHLHSLDDQRVGAVEPDPTLHPLDAAARLVQEDLVLMVERSGSLVCAGGSVCFPNRWDLASKIGATMSAIHAPVPQLNDQLAVPIDGFLRRLTPQKSFWRLGWGLLDTDDLYQPTDGTAPDRDVGTAADKYFLRVERETLRRMPRTGCVLFTIRTHISPIAAIDPTRSARHLAESIAAFPDDVADYKELASIGDAMAEWLHHRSIAGV